MLQKMDYVSLGCSALAFVLYLNTLNSGFVYDDRRAILANTDVSGNTPWHAAFTNDFWGTPLTDSGSHGSYRPLCVLSFRINFLFGGYTAWSFHLVNNLMHCLATGLVVKLARYFFSSIWGVLATGALFAVHPIHTEAVAGIVGRADLAACIFYLLTYLTYMKHIRWREHCDPRQWYALAMTVVLSVLALLFKETAISVLFVCGLFDVIRGWCGIHDKNRFRSLMILAVALISSVCYRLVLLPRPQTAFSTADNPIAKSNSVLTRFLTFAYLPVFNFKLMLNSNVLSFDWGMDAIPRITCFSDKRNIFTLCFYSALLLVIWRTVNTLLNNKINQALSEQTIPPGTQYHIQQRTHRKSRTKRKSRTDCLPPTSSKNINNNTTYNLLEDSKIENTPAHLSYKPANILPVVKPKVLRCLCYECKQDISAGHHTTTCRVLNNNNNLVVNNATSIYNDCCCHQIVSSRAADIQEPVQTLVPHHVIAVAFLRAITGVNPRNSRSSSSCSNSTTLSEKSSGSSAYSSSSSASKTSSTSIINSMNFHKNHNYMLTHVPPNSQNACVLLMAVAFLTLPFLPATNLLFYVGFVVAERLLYLPSVGYCLLVGFGVTKLMMPSTMTRQNNQKHKLALIIFMSLALTSMSVRTLRRNVDWRDEESLYRSAIEVNPPKALGNLGSVLSSQGRYEEAKLALAEALKFRPNMADVHFNLGILHQNQQNYKSAIECFQRAIHFRPNLAVAYLNLGISLIAIGKCQEAIQALQKCTKLDGIGVRDRVAHDNARISSYLQLGALYVEQGKLQRSLAVYREALHTLPASLYQRDVLYHRIGDIFGRLHQWDEAEKHHRVALEMQPNHVGAHLSYGITLARNTSRAIEAEMWFKRALHLAPQQASVYHHYAEFLNAQSRGEEAIFYRVRAAEISPQDYSLAVAAATAYRLLDRKTDAELWYRKAVALRPNDAHAHTNLGAILHLLGLTSKAAASYKEALRLQPGDPTTLSNLAKLGVTSETE